MQLLPCRRPGVALCEQCHKSMEQESERMTDKPNCYDCKNHGRPDLSGMVDWCRYYRIYLYPRFVDAEECEGYDPLPEY